MAQIKLIAPTLLGIEAVTAKELKRLGYNNVKVENGRVSLWVMNGHLPLKPLDTHCRKNFNKCW